MSEPFDAADVIWPKVELTDWIGALFYDAGWSRPWWAFWRRPPKPVVFEFNPAEPGSRHGLLVSLAEDGTFILHTDGEDS